MKTDRKLLIIHLAIPLAVGGLAALLSADGIGAYSELNRPPLAPPGWVFPVVWTVLYLAMGYSAWLVHTSCANDTEKRRALAVYALQLCVNFLWPLLFFRAGFLLSAFFLLLLLWLLVFITWRLFCAVSERAGTLLLPYLLWVTFAAYLNYGFFLAN